jgi:TetR/AcrR family acrAB operon transcriptional repressor
MLKEPTPRARGGASARPGRTNGGAARRDQSRSELLRTAIDCFARYGYQGTSIDRIASAAGVTKGALYYHFKDKEDLLFEAVKDRVGAFENLVVGNVSPETDAAGALAAIARVSFDVATRNNLRRFFLTLMVEAIDTNPRLSEQFREILRRFRIYLKGIIRLGQEQGVFRTDVDATLAAQLFAGGVIGAEVQHYQDGERVDLGVAMEGLAAQMLSWLTRGAIELPTRPVPQPPARGKRGAKKSEAAGRSA